MVVLYVVSGGVFVGVYEVLVVVDGVDFVVVC